MFLLSHRQRIDEVTPGNSMLDPNSRLGFFSPSFQADIVVIVVVLVVLVLGVGVGVRSGRSSSSSSS